MSGTNGANGEKRLKKKFQITKINFFYPKLENGSVLSIDYSMDPKGSIVLVDKISDPKSSCA